MFEGKIIDLSHTMYDGREEYGLKQEIFNTADRYPQYKTSEDTWYIMQNITMSSHCGTHIELPYHHVEDGYDASNFPLEGLMGEAVMLDFCHKKAGEMVSLDEVKEQNAKISKGDIVLFRYDLSWDYYNGGPHKRPFVEVAAIEWLINEKKMKVLGTDASGFEKGGDKDQPIHTLCLKNNVPIIEFGNNFGKVTKERFFVFALPLPMAKLDSSPVRLIAIEE